MLNDLINEIDKQISFVLDDEAALAFIALLLVGVWLRVMIKRRRLPALQQERPTATTNHAKLDLATEIARLSRLHRDGALDDDEYKAAKAKLLSDDSDSD